MILIHPDSTQEIDVDPARLPLYLSQGWRRPEAEAPRGNATRAEWVAYALTRGFTEADLDGLGRDAIRAALA